MRGADGFGKTTLLHRYVDVLSEDGYYATVDTGVQRHTRVSAAASVASRNRSAKGSDNTH
jgi:GTPase SAR1 family protein